MNTASLFLFLSFNFLSGCSKSHNSNASIANEEQLSIVGSWKLVETLADPGNGSERWTLVSGNVSFITFNSDNSIHTNMNFKQYKIVSERSIEFTQSNGNKVTYSYEVNETTLILYPPCIEACGLKFIKSSVIL